jgi:hypothetical protein
MLRTAVLPPQVGSLSGGQTLKRNVDGASRHLRPAWSTRWSRPVLGSRHWWLVADVSRCLVPHLCPSRPYTRLVPALTFGVDTRI